jgi:hypothetical protein
MAIADKNTRMRNIVYNVTISYANVSPAIAEQKVKSVAGILQNALARQRV